MEQGNCPLRRSKNPPNSFVGSVKDEKLRYMCNIDGHCVRSSGKAVLIKAGDGSTFWIPIRCLEDPDDPPSAGEIIDRMEVPGFKILEAHIEHLVE